MQSRTTGRTFFLATLVLACVFAGGLGWASEPDDGSKLLEIVKNYVEATKSWPPGDYSIRRSRTEGRSVIYTVVHKDDEASFSPGGGKSIEVHVDAGTMKVSKELSFQ